MAVDVEIREACDDSSPKTLAIDALTSVEAITKACRNYLGDKQVRYLSAEDSYGNFVHADNSNGTWQIYQGNGITEIAS